MSQSTQDDPGTLEAILDFFERPFQLDLRSLALLRVGLAILLLVDLINRGLYLGAHYTDWGVLPRQALMETLWDRAWLSVHLFSGTFWPTLILFVVTGLAALFLLVGWRTRLATIVSWFLVISLHGRNPMVLQGGDILFRLLLFWSIFLPLGARWSVDAALDDQRGPPDEEDEADAPTRIASAATFAYIAQICFIYVFAAILKDGPEWRQNFSATYYALSLDQFTTPLGDWLWTKVNALKYLTIYTLIVEGAGWLLILVPVGVPALRLLAIGIFVSMHLGFAFTMQLGLFSYIAAIGWLALLPSWFWEQIADQLGDFGDGVTIRVAATDGAAGKAARLFRQLLFLTRSDLTIDGELEEGWRIVTPDGEAHAGWEGLIAMVEASPVFGSTAGVIDNGLFARLWRLVHDREAFRAGLDYTLSLRPYRIKQTLVGGLVVTFALAGAFWWNMQTLNSKWGMSQPWRTIAVYFRLDQKWNMFAPYPLKEDGWYVIPGTLRDGTRVDLFQDNSPPRWEKPDDVSATYQSQRWRKYMMNLWLAKYSEQRLYYGKYLCRKWNQNHRGEKQLMTFKIYFQMEKSLPNYKVPEPERRHLWTHYCFKKPKENKNANEGDSEGGQKVPEGIFDEKTSP